MDPKCHICFAGTLVSNASKAGTLICDACGFTPPMTVEKVEALRVKAVEVLRDARASIWNCDYSWEAFRQGGPRSMPAVIGHVRSRIDRAYELLQGLEI